MSHFTAKNISDEKTCADETTTVNGLFCSFHSKQCQGAHNTALVANLGGVA